MAIVNSQPIELVLQDTIERVDILVVDENGDPVDATEVHLKIFDAGGNLLIEDDYFAPDDPPTHIVKPAGTTGQYYWPFGDDSFNDDNATDTPGEFLFQWRVTGSTGTESVNIVQLVKVVSVTMMSLFPKLRLMIDKSAKLVDDASTDPCFLGYTDWMLAVYLEGGLQIINAAPPYPTFACIEEFPKIHEAILIDAAMFRALMSQELFAIDEDIQYNDNGHSFSIDHYPKLSASLNGLWARLQQSVPLMKRQYLANGSVRIEYGTNWKFALVTAAAPSNSLFRGFWLGGQS